MKKGKKIKIWISVMIIMVIAIAAIAVFSVRTQKQETIKIGVIGPYTGSLARHGEWMRNAVEMAKDKINQEGFHQIQLIYEDTKCLPQKTTTALNKLINVDNIVGYIGPFCGSPEFIAAEISTAQRKIGISPSSNYGKISEYFFSTQALLSDEPTTMANFAYNNLGLRRVAILYFNNDFGLIHKDTFKKEFENMGGEITDIEIINSFTQTDFRTELTKIKATNSEGIYIAYSSIGIIVNQIKELGLEVQILSQYGIETPEFLDIAKENANGVIYTYRGATEENKLDSQKEFEKKYKERYDESAGLVAAESYDALMILNKVLKTCENEYESDCIKNTILSIKDYQGASGSISFDPETYGVDKPIIIKTVKNSQFVVYEGD